MLTISDLKRLREFDVDQRQLGLAAREVKLHRGAMLTFHPGELDAEREPLEERERLLAAREAALADKELRLAVDEARFHADQDIREEKLRRPAGYLTTYLAQERDELERREQEWWRKQLGAPLVGAAS